MLRSFGGRPERTYNGLDRLGLKLSIDDEVPRRARLRAEALGVSVDRLVRQYLEQLTETSDPIASSAEFARLSRISAGNSRGWKFNRDEIHERRWTRRCAGSYSPPSNSVKRRS